jgi:hypothetical protein
MKRTGPTKPFRYHFPLGILSFLTKHFVGFSFTSAYKSGYKLQQVTYVISEKGPVAS